jgi:hypothetical protein
MDDIIDLVIPTIGLAVHHLDSGPPLVVAKRLCTSLASNQLCLAEEGV